MATAEDVKATEANEPQKEGAKEKEPSKEFNRQVNYFIMRYMWQVICGRTSKGVDDTIYNAFQTSRERYTRVINTGKIRYGKGELEALSQLTGIDKAIFTGERMFKCSYTVQKEIVDSQTKQPKAVTNERYIPLGDWKAMFQWRNSKTGEADKETLPTEPKGQAKQGKARTETPQDKICAQLKRADRTNVQNWDFYQLCYYLTNRRAAPIRQEDETLRSIEMSIKALTFTLLDRCQVSQLQNLQKLMKDKQQIISNMIGYKSARDKERSKKKAQ